MNYYYDVLINFNDLIPYSFYEWQKDDSIIHLKKVPIFKIATSDLLNFYKYQFQVEESFLELIRNKTEVYDNSEKYFEYVALFTDENQALAIEFSNKGLSLSKSTLLISEELDLLEISYSLKVSKLIYTKLEKTSKRANYRQLSNLKRIINIEINELYSNNNLSKLRYLYNEVFADDQENIDVIYEKLSSIIKSNYNNSHLKLYNLIKLSYKNLSI